MGAEAGILAGITAGMGMIQGMSAYHTGQAEASMRETEGILLEGEAMREADRIEDEGRRFAARQKMAYIGSGVEIGGSAVVTLAQTDKWAQAEAESVRDRGRAMREYYDRAGRIARNQGKAAFISGIAGGIASGISVYSATKMPGAGGSGADVTKTGAVKTTGKGGYGSGASAYKSLGVR
jgi:hypothetical protein